MPGPKTPSDQELLDAIRKALERLRLKEMLEQLDAELAAPRDDDTRLEWLWRLLEVQVRARNERALQRRIDDSHLPGHKTLDSFDFGFQPKLDRERVMELATLDFVRKGQNLLIAGMSGTGKSHISIALGHLACVAGIRTLYTTSAAMLSKLHASLASHDLGKVIRPFLRAELLIIDEVGLDRPERDTSGDAHLFYKVVGPRYESQAATIITSNIEWEHWGAYLGDDVATVAILDRLIHHGHLLRIEGPSYRAEQHKKLNAQPTEPDTDE